MARAAHATTVPALLLAGLATLAMTTPGPLAGAIPVRELPAGGTAGLLRAPLWTAIRAPLPAGAGTSPDSYLYGMACPSASTCAAAGNYVDRAGTSQGLLLTGHGSSWTATKAPLPAAAGASPSDVSLFGVVCPSAVACVAAGSYTDSAGNPEGLLMHEHRARALMDSNRSAAAPRSGRRPGRQPLRRYLRFHLPLRGRRLLPRLIRQLP